MSVAFIDIFFLVIIALFSILVAVKGFVAEFFGKAAFGLAVIFAVLFFDNLTPFVASFIPAPVVPAIVAFILIFSAVYIALKVIQVVTKKLFFSGTVMGGLDRSLGFLLGLVEGIVICALLCVLLLIQPFLDLSSVLANSLFFAVLQPLIGLEPIIIPASEPASVSSSILNLVNPVLQG